MKGSHSLSTRGALPIYALFFFAGNWAALAGPLNPPPGPVSPTGRFGPRTGIHAADLPLTISSAGSYYLAENITTAGGGITIAANDVTLDLNGFMLRGGTGDGILVSGFPKKNIEIKSGVIAGWAEDGIDAVFGQNCRFENLRLLGNTGNGLRARDSAVITGCTAQENGGIGISTSAGCSVSNCTARSNTGAGISAGGDTTVVNCASEANTGVGIVVGFGSRVRDCVSAFSGDDGIQASADAVVQDCTARNNTGDGIQVTSECRVLGNHCTGNGFNGDGAGIHAAGGANRIEDNYCLDADRGLDIDSLENFVSRNTVFRNTDNYDIAAGNRLEILLCQIPESIDWPATVTLAGSLTGIIGQNGITITSDDVTIDLAGHALIGVPGSLDGISVPGPNGLNLALRNGTVRDWGSEGINLAVLRSQLERLRVSGNGGHGIVVGSEGTITCSTSSGNAINGMIGGNDCIVDNCDVSDNLGDGMLWGSGCILKDCTAYSNDDEGIVTSNGCTVVACTAYDNGDGASALSKDGIRVGVSCSIIACSAYSNADDGFVLPGAGCSITDSTAYANTGDGIEGGIGTITGCSAIGNNEDGIHVVGAMTITNCATYQNFNDGIEVADDSFVFQNTCDSNGPGVNNGANIHVTGSDNRIDGNQCTDADRGIDVDGAGNIIVRNTCSGNTTNWDIVAGNAVAPIVAATTNGAAILGNTYAGSLGSTDPNANFTY